MHPPAFWSLAFEEIRDPDYAGISVDVLPAHATADPAAWARSVVSPRSLPRWLVVLVTARQRIAPLFGMPRAPRDRFRVQRVAGDEALLAVDFGDLDVRIAVGVDERHGLVRLVTTVRLKGRRGRAWLIAVRVLHPHLARAVMSRTRIRLSGVTA